MRAQDDPKGLRIINSVADTGFRGAYIMGVTGAAEGSVLGGMLGMAVAGVPGIVLGAICGAIIAICVGAATGLFSFLLARLIGGDPDDAAGTMDRIEHAAIRGSVVGVGIGVGYILLQTMDSTGEYILAIIAGFVIGTFIGAIVGARAEPAGKEPTANDANDSWLRIDVGRHIDKVHVRIVEADRRDGNDTRIGIDRSDETETGEAGSGAIGLRLERPSPLVEIDLLLPGQHPLTEADTPDTEHAPGNRG